MIEPVPTTGTGGRVMTWLLGVATAASLGGLAWATNTSGLGFGVTLGAENQPSSLPAVSPQRGVVGAKPTTSALRQRADGAGGATAMPRAASQAQGTQALDAGAQSARTDQEAQDRRRHAAVQAELDAQALAAARRNVSIEMYSTSWCGVCTVARSYMREHGIAFVDHDIDQDADAMARAHALNPHHSVPVLDVGGEVMIGFSGETLEATLDHAARKRVGL